MVEEFRSIEGFNGYEASNLGRIKSLKRPKAIILRQATHKRGYMQVGLMVNGKSKSIMVHTLVAIAFLNHKPDGTHRIVVDHKDHNKTNNHITNLQLITNRENASKDQFRFNRSSKYIGVSWSKVNKKWIAFIQVDGVRRFLGGYSSELDASDAYQKALNHINKGLDINTIFPRKKHANKYKGISFNKLSGKWETRITVNKERLYLGQFETEIQAYNAYKNYIKLNHIKI